MQRLIWVAVFLTAFSLPAWAEESPGSMYCSDHHGTHVKMFSDSSARKISEANIATGGYSTIRINLGQLSDLSANARSFAVGFSCARLTLGHLVKGAENIYEHFDQVENADCWAAGKLFYEGGVDKKGLTALEEEINHLNREQWSHLPGPVRVISLNDTCKLTPLN